MVKRTRPVLDWGEEKHKNNKSLAPQKDAIGLVLSGGGAKGAFQAGVWQAMCELGLAKRVTAISGTSVGALNGAAFAVLNDADAACRIWLEHVGEVASANLRALSADALLDGVRNLVEGKAFPFHGLLDRGALEHLVRTILPETWPTNAPPVCVTALECRARCGEELRPSAYTLKRFQIDQEKHSAIRTRQLLASAAIPWGFDPVEIDGIRYVDGGWDKKGGDNIPIIPILEQHPEIRTLIVVRCNSREVEPAPLDLPKQAAGMQIVEIRPKTLYPVFSEISWSCCPTIR